MDTWVEQNVNDIHDENKFTVQTVNHVVNMVAVGRYFVCICAEVSNCHTKKKKKDEKDRVGLFCCAISHQRPPLTNCYSWVYCKILFKYKEYGIIKKNVKKHYVLIYVLSVCVSVFD